MRTILVFLSLLVVWGSYAQPVVRTEYFFDNDPGYGNGTSATLTPGNLVNLNFNANTTGLDAGVHTLFVRVKSGLWSQTYSRLIGVSPDIGITQAEYFFDNDPGFGNGIPIAVTPANVVALNFNTNTTGLSPGIHILFVRVKSGTWSQTHSRLIAVSPETGISQAEYFFDSDPGFGNGTAINLTPGNLVNLDFDANTTGLTPGIHTLFVRVKSGIWSQTHARLVGVNPDVGITQAEYFFNADPGFGNGTPITITPGKVVELNFEANASSLNPGIHTLFVRVKSGIWSQSHARLIAVNTENGITQAEYFMGEDPGYGNGIPIDIAPGNLVILNFDIENMSLENGLHYIYFRTFSGVWSQTHIHEFCQNPIPDFTTDFAELGNPTTFTNLSQQTDEITEYFWDVNGDGSWDYFGGDDFLHVYDAPGSYLAKLKLVSPGGCADSIVHEVLVYACMVPTELTAENITYNSANLNWTPGNFGNQWDILWGLQGFDPETEGTLIEGVTEQPYFLSGLEDQTAYDFYVRTVCDGEVSNWSGPQTFTTLEYICEPDWTTSLYFQYNMQVIGKLFIDGEQSFDPNDKIGAFVNGECRGIAVPDPNLFGLVFLTVGSDVTSGEMVEFIIWNVAECTECTTGESMIFENQLQVGTPGNPYPFECGQHELPFVFGEGYTWFSVNLDPGSMLLNNLFEPLSPCEDDRILGQNTFATWYNNQWMGSLTEVAPSWMYKMELCSQQSLTITGQPVANDPIALGAGYTWLGYLPQGGLTINDALAGLQPAAAEDNRLIGQNAFAVYYQGQWIGSLTQLHPGKGYIVELSNQSTLTYPDAAKSDAPEPEKEIISPTDEMPLANLQYNMMLIAQLELPDGSISLNPDDVIYAFSGEECRGMAIPIEEHNGAIFMSIGADVLAGELITFKAWLSEFGALEDINETISFETLKKAGTMEQPVLLTLKGFTGIGGNIAGGVVIGEPFPNPFTESTEISYKLNIPAQVKLSIYNSHGQLINIIADGFHNAGLHKETIQRNGLAPGVYFFRMTIFNNDFEVQKNGKIIISQ
jgi:PKD repeat protein